MSTEQKPVQIDSWEGLCRYIEFLRHGSEKQMKICVIDEENDEIRLQTREEFDVNVQYAQEHNIESLTFVIYLDDQHLFNGIYKIPQTIIKQQFPSDKFQILLDNVLTDKWYIPIKQDEAFGICLIAAIELAQENQLETNNDCQRFVETIVPEAFRKLQNTQSVSAWPREIQSGIFELLELLVDLVGTRLRYAPVPITLLNTLAMTFDTNTIFAQKHKNELIPSKRTYTLKDEDFLSNDFDTETHGWLRSIIQRFIAQNGLSYIRLQFQNLDSKNAAKEYNALLKLFAKCNRCINAHRYRMLFARPIHQAIEYFDNERGSNGMTDELNELKDTLLDICYKYDLKDEINHPALSINNYNSYEILCPSIEICSETTPLIETSKSNQRKTKKKDCYERLAEDIQTMTMNSNDSERQCVKKQRTEEQIPTTNSLLECIDEILTTTNKRSMRRKHRREQKQQQRISSHSNKETKTTFDRTNPDDILRYFKPMKQKIANLYDDLHTAIANGKIREVLKIEEKLKLLNPFSARFIADENTPDGTIMRPGQVFRKSWVVLNDGSMPWDSEDIQLVNLSDGIKIIRQPIVPITAPHTRTILSVDYECSKERGIYESKWILAYREKTFGPMIWCSIEISDENKPIIINDFEFIDVPLPACFDLTKPFNSSIRSNPSFSYSESLFNDIISSKNSFSSQSSVENQPSLIDLPLPTNEEEDEQQILVRSNQSLDFVDTVVTNIFSVAKQAGSTAKAIFNTLQAHEEISTVKTPILINSAAPKDPMQVLIEMGFGNRVQNQRLLKDNGNDLSKVIQLLTFDTNEDVDCFIHRH